MKLSTSLVLCALLVLSVLLGSVPAVRADSGLAVQVLPSEEQCFYARSVGPDESMFLRFMVVSGGSQDIDVTIRGPDGKVVWEVDADTENRVFFKAEREGVYSFCFSNKISTFTPKIVSFMISVGPAEGKKGKAAADATDSLLKHDKLSRTILRIGQGIDEVEELQDYLAIREKRHRSTVEVANTRVFLFALLEVIVVVGMGGANIIFIRRMFKMKRMV